MALPTFVLDQLSRPQGRLAPLTAAFLNGVNARTILAGVSALDIEPGQRVVEVGFGGGLSLPLLLRAVGPSGQVFGFETSDEMLVRARRRFFVPRLRGRLRVDKAWIEALPLGESCFDAALSINTIMFWTDVEVGMRELARVLRPGGRLVLGVPEPAQAMAMGFAERGFRVVVPERLGEQLPRYGFELLSLRTTPDGTSLAVARRVDDGYGDEL